VPVAEPFRALHYAIAPQLGEVLAPPYDVISPEQRDDLYARSPYNVVRMVLGREHDPYAEAARFLREWTATDILRTDDLPAYYILQQEFEALGRTFVRTGVIGRCSVEPPSVQSGILPHEKTLAKPKEDRFKLLQSIATQDSQIFGIIQDPKHEFAGQLLAVTQEKPLVEVTFDNVIQRVWVITEEDFEQFVARHAEASNVLIADGHHRFETAIRYRDWRRAEAALPTPHDVDYTMMYLTSEHDPGLVVLPTHRLVFGLAEFSPEKFIRELSGKFHVVLMERHDGQVPETSLFVVVLPSGSYAVFPKQPPPSGIRPTDGETVLKNLPLTILHSVVFEEILGIDKEAQLQKRNLEYTEDAADVQPRVSSGVAQIGFLIRPVDVWEIFAISNAGLVMPQKSTYFYPKLPSGLVMYQM